MLDTVNYSSNERTIFDVVGVGFGPSNVSFAIAARELSPQLSMKFIEAKECFSWHKNMFFPNADMQISFLKDLVTFRNPCSSYSFMNYVHSKGRLADFANLAQFCPSREEFNDYLTWCARQFDDQVAYGQQVTKIQSVPGEDSLLQVVSRDRTGKQHTVTTRSLVYAAGLRPSFPEGCQPGQRVIHCSQVLEKFASLPNDKQFDVTVVGGGQSAAEVVEYLHNNFTKCRITSVVSAFGYMPADDTPFVNQIFDPDWVSPFYDASEEVKQEVLVRHATTNYAAVDRDLISTLYHKTYHDKLSGENRLRFQRLTRVNEAQEGREQVTLKLQDKLAGKTTLSHADYLVCATGYQSHEIGEIFSPALSQKLQHDDKDRLRFSRSYGLCFEDSSNTVPIYCVGMNQYSHGLTSTLLSNMAVRSGEILADLENKLSENNATSVSRMLSSAIS